MDIRDKIIKEIRTSREGCTISELAEKLGTSRNTVAIVFAFLEGAKKVHIRKTGMAKIYFWESKK